MHTILALHVFVVYTLFIRKGVVVMKNLAIRIEDNLENRLNNLAVQTGRTKTFYIKQALEEYLESKEDYLLGLAVLENPNEKEYSLTEVKNLLK